MPTVHLISIGSHPAKLASDLCVGDVTVWNFGVTAPIIAVREVSRCFLEIDIIENGKNFTRRLRKDRLVAVISK